MSDSEAKYNLLKSSCFTPSAANQADGSYALADGWVLGGGRDSRTWGAGHAEWAVELPAGAYALLYEVDGKQGARYDMLQAFIDTKVIAIFNHHDGPYIGGAKFTLDADSTVKIMVKCIAPARYRLMLVEGTEPAAWAPAEGEELAGGGALMSANLWDVSTANKKPDADGVYLCGKSAGALYNDITGASALAENQTIHMGASLRGAGKGTLKPHVAYVDAAGNMNWVGFPDWTPSAEWQRFEGSCVVPSGMTPMSFGFNKSAATGDIEVLNPTFSYGSPVCLASSAHTPYATQDHVSTIYATKAALKVTSDAVTAEVTERGKLAGRVDGLESTSSTHTSKLEQLATSIKSLVKGESTYTDPDGKSATSGIYSLVTQTKDSVTALFGQYTKTEDLASTQAVKDAKKAGTDAQAAASAAQSTADSAKSTAQTAASDAATAKTNAASAVSTANSASSTAGGAKSTADSLATMIREDATGITVGKSADGQTWSTGRTHMTVDSFDVLDKAGTAMSSFGAKLVSLLKGTFQIKVWDGHSAGAMLQADDLSLSSKYQTMVSSVAPKASEGSMASAADTVYLSGATKSPDGVSELAITNEVFDASDKSLGTTKLTTDGFTTNVPLEAAVTRTTLATGVVLECTCGIAVLHVDGVKHATGYWGTVSLGTVPAGYRPKQAVRGAVVRQNELGSIAINVATDGEVTLANLSGSTYSEQQLCSGTLSWVYTG